jgi:hypothetical protein
MPAAQQHAVDDAHVRAAGRMQLQLPDLLTAMSGCIGEQQHPDVHVLVLATHN